MKYEEYLQSPDIHRAFDNMFEQQRIYYKLRVKEIGLPDEDTVTYSIKLANVSTDLHFTELYKKEPNNF